METKNELSRSELIKLLIGERNLHFSHPHELSRKLIFSLSGIITSVFIALFIKKSTDESFMLISAVNSSCNLTIISIILICIGYTLILWGLYEHSSIHGDQRRQIEKSLEYLLAVKDEDFNLNDFWEKHGKSNLKYFGNKKLSSSTFLVVAEPDTRGFIWFHDRKIELGILMNLIGFLVFLSILF